jgi:sugar lactone lactonase YvrE
VWSVAEQALYWVDIEGPCIHRLDWASRTQRSWVLTERVGCIALSDRGTVIAAMESGIFEVELLDPPQVRVTRLASVEHPQPGMRFNDGRCDAQGRFWSGTMVRDMGLASTAGGIYGLDQQGLRGPVLGGYITPNGMAFSPDGQTAYLSDSHPSVQKIWAHAFDANTGTWGQQTEWVDMKALPGRPDGAAVDAEGCYWICGNDAGLVHRFSPAGALLQTLPVPVSKPAMCAFGGPELRHLFVTSIQPAQPAAGFDAALDGAVFVLEPGVQGLAEPVFSQFPAR